MYSRPIAQFLLLACGFSASCSSQTPAAPQAQQAPPARVSQSDLDLERKMRTEVVRGDLDEIVKRRYLRVLVVPDRLSFFFDNGQMGGTAHEGVMEFERILNLKNRASKLPLSVVFIPVRRDQA